jgi:hypothetical protein
VQAGLELRHGKMRRGPSCATRSKFFTPADRSRELLAAASPRFFDQAFLLSLGGVDGVPGVPGSRGAGLRRCRL